LSLVLLDTNHIVPVAGEQTAWLERTLADRQDRPHLIVANHVPAYPSFRPPHGGDDDSSHAGDSHECTLSLGWPSLPRENASRRIEFGTIRSAGRNEPRRDYGIREVYSTDRNETELKFQLGRGLFQFKETSPIPDAIEKRCMSQVYVLRGNHMSLPPTSFQQQIIAR